MKLGLAIILFVFSAAIARTAEYEVEIYVVKKPQDIQSPKVLLEESNEKVGKWIRDPLFSAKMLHVKIGKKAEHVKNRETVKVPVSLNAEGKGTEFKETDIGEWVGVTLKELHPEVISVEVDYQNTKPVTRKMSYQGKTIQYLAWGDNGSANFKFDLRVGHWIGCRMDLSDKTTDDRFLFCKVSHSESSR